MTTPLRDRVHARLLAEGAGLPLDRHVCDIVREEAPLLSRERRARLVAQVLADVGGLGPLEPLLADPEVTEVMVNGPGPVWVERAGVLERTTVECDTPTIEHLIEKVV